MMSLPGLGHALRALQRQQQQQQQARWITQYFKRIDLSPKKLKKAAWEKKEQERVDEGKKPEQKAAESSVGSLSDSVVEKGEKKGKTDKVESAALRDPLKTTHIERHHEIKYSPRKMTQILKLIRNKPIDEALLQMQFSQKRKAREEVYRALHRGKINAKTNHHMDRSKLYVAEAYATKGKYLKRLDIKGRGRSGQRKKPFCHIVIKLKERGKVLSRTERIVKKFKKLTFRPKGVSRLY